MKYLNRRALLGLLAALVVCPSFGEVSIDDAWLRATPPGQTVTALYFTISNHSERHCVLTEVSTPLAERAEMHRTLEEDGMMKMRHQESFPIPPHGTLVLAPGAEHIMLYGLAEQLQPGMTTAVRVDFAGCGELTIEAEVRDAAATRSGGHDHHH